MAVLSASVCMTHDTNLELGSQHEYMPARQLEHLAEETGALLCERAILDEGAAAAVSSNLTLTNTITNCSIFCLFV